MITRLATVLQVIRGGTSDEHAAADQRCSELRTELAKVRAQISAAAGISDPTAALDALITHAVRAPKLGAELEAHATELARLQRFAAEACALTGEPTHAGALGAMSGWKSWALKGRELDSAVEHLRTELHELERENRVLRQYLRTPKLFRSNATDREDR